MGSLTTEELKFLGSQIKQFSKKLIESYFKVTDCNLNDLSLCLTV